MADLSGITGPMTAAEHARVMASGVGAFAADAPGMLVGTVLPNGTRQVRIPAGTARAAGGRLAETAAADSPSADQNVSPTPRTDALVYRTDIAGAGTCTMQWIKGQANGEPPLVTYGATNLARINRQVGSVYDALLGFGVIRSGIGALPEGDWAPTIPTGGVGGDFRLAFNRFRTYIDVPLGGHLAIDETRNRYRRNGLNSDFNDWVGAPVHKIRTPRAGLVGGVAPDSAEVVVQTFLHTVKTKGGGFIDLVWPSPFSNGVSSIQLTPIVDPNDPIPFSLEVNGAGHNLAQSSLRVRQPNGQPRANQTVKFFVTVTGW